MYTCEWAGRLIKPYPDPRFYTGPGFYLLLVCSDPRALNEAGFYSREGSIRGYTVPTFIGIGLTELYCSIYTVYRHILYIYVQYTGTQLHSIHICTVYRYILHIYVQYTTHICTVYYTYVYSILHICVQYTTHMCTVYYTYVYSILHICVQYTGTYCTYVYMYCI